MTSLSKCEDCRATQTIIRTAEKHAVQLSFHLQLHHYSHSQMLRQTQRRHTHSSPCIFEVKPFPCRSCTTTTYGCRLQVHFPGGNQAQVQGRSREVWSHLPSTRRFLVSSSCHLDTDWTSGNQWAGRRCATTRSGIWVLKGNARARMLPENLDHLRVRWISRGTYETAWVTPGHDCLCSYQYRHGAAVRPQTNHAIWHGVIGLWSRVAPFLSPWCDKKDVPTGVNLNQYAGSGSFIRGSSDNEPLFGPQNLPKLIVSLSLGNSVEFMVRRRAPGNVPSSIRLDHGDVLVMDGLAQSEYEHCTASELQGPRFNLTYVAQHTASCPQAGVVGCVLPTCAQGLVEPSSRWLGEGENKWSSSWGLVLLLLILVSVLLVNTWIHTRRRHRHSGQHLSCSVVHFLSRGRVRWVGRRRRRLSRRRQSSKGVSFYFPLLSFIGDKPCSFFSGYGFFTFSLPLEMLVAKREEHTMPP